MQFENLVPSLIAGAIGTSAAWFAFARSVTTRKDVSEMLAARVAPLEARQTRQEFLLEDIRHELGELSKLTAKLTVLLQIRNHDHPDAGV